MDLVGSATSQCCQGLLSLGLVTICSNLLQSSDLTSSDFFVVNGQDVDGVLLIQDVLVDPNNHLGRVVNVGLASSSAFFNLQLGPARGYGLGHASHALHFINDALGLVVDLLGQRLHHVGASPGIDDLGDASLFLQDQLRVAGQSGDK